VVEGGLAGLTTEWARIASDVENNATWVWEEWLNDLDTRQLLHELLEDVPDADVALPKVIASDARFRKFAQPTDECAWGHVNAAHHGWTRERNWWYWTEPPTPYEE
jgi:hypothetical protein